MLFSLQKSILKLSLTDPPGCIIEFIPTVFAISTQSGNGKKASLAIQASERLKLNFFAFSIA